MGKDSILSYVVYRVPICLIPSSKRRIIMINMIASGQDARSSARTVS